MNTEYIQFKAVLEWLGEGVTLSDIEGKFIFYNLRMQEITGFTMEEANNSGDFSKLIYPDLLERQKALHRSREIEENKPTLPLEVETVIQAKDGAKKLLWISSRVIKLEDGEMFLSIYRDISLRKFQEEEFKKKEEKLEIQAWGLKRTNDGIKLLYKELEKTEDMRFAKLAAENANYAKSEFLSTMSHELRTPLNAIIGFSEVLKAESYGPLNDKQKDYMNDVWESGKYLLSLINDILDLSKVEAGKMVLELGELNLRTVIPNCLVMVQERSLNRGVVVSMDIDDSITSIVADERKIKQIIYNLLSNAIKFTPENGRIGLEVKPKSDKEILFSVWDNGIGIEEKDKGKIFQGFTRIDSAYSRKSQGTGLGLTLTKKLVELHGGKIWFESQGKDKGTQFSFTLPNKTLKADQDKPCVLLIEDDPKSAKLISEYLHDFGCVLEVVSSGEEGLEKAKLLKPSFIILDIILPHKDGWDVLIELKMNPLTKDIPVMVTTVLRSQEGKGLTLGAVDYLIKPISKIDLEKALAKISFPEKDRSKPIKILVIDDDETILKIMEAILITKGFQVLMAQDSHSGLELCFKEKPDLILLDLVMPVMTGFDVLVQLRGNPLTKDVPVIVMTAKLLTAEEKKILKSQAQTIIEKSKFNKDSFLREIGLIMGRRKQG